VPASRSRLTFFHQAITEFLAAKKLAEEFKLNPEVLSKQLQYTRWDHALLLTIGFLDEETSNSFIQKIIETDIGLALRAIKYLEFESEQVTTQVLESLSNMDLKPVDVYGLAWYLNELPLSEDHRESLYGLIKHGNMLGATAVILLQRMRYISNKQVIDIVFENASDYNFCAEIGREFGDIDLSLWSYIWEKLSKAQERFAKFEDDLDGITSGLASIGRRLRVEDLLSQIEDWDTLNKYQLDVIADALTERASPQSISTLIQMVKQGYKEAVFPFYISIAYSNDELEIDWAILDEELLEILIRFVEDEDFEDEKENGKWALGSIESICRYRTDSKRFIRQEVNGKRGILRLALLYCCLPESQDDIWKEFSNIANNVYTLTENEPYQLIYMFDDLNWENHIGLFIKLMNKKHRKLAYNLLDSFKYEISPNVP